jgi:uncharacterized oligopeptide transporter (OPT) family protein
LNNRNQDLKAPGKEYDFPQVPEKHPSVFEPGTIILAIFLGTLGVIIGLELITRVGITPNTSIIGAIIAIAISRVPVNIFKSFRSLTRQNLIQTVVSGATFGSANAIFVPIGILYLMGKYELIPAMMIGAVLGLIIDSFIMYKIFDSRIYPADGTWPIGVAVSECIIAGDRGGKRAKLLGTGGVIGGFGRYLGIPMEIFGVCWIGNIWAMAMFGIGLLVRGYSSVLINVDINEIYLPHGVMIGAGVIALIQIFFLISKSKKGKSETASFTRTDKQLKHGIGTGFLLFIFAASLMAAITGIYIKMSFLMIIGFILFAAIAALTSELIVGISAMHAGWFPAFATTLIFLVLGLLIGFPQIPLAIIVGFTASTGPAFADMAYDLKAGWILRGKGKYPEFERQGRRQQFYAELIGFGIAAIFVFLFYNNYFAADLFPPVDRVFVKTIESGAHADVAKYLLIWAIPGAIIQLLGSLSRQIGILFATGLLILNPVAGWTVVAALVIRILLYKKFGESVRETLYILAGGFIAGSALCSFGTTTLKLE